MLNRRHRPAPHAIGSSKQLPVSTSIEAPSEHRLR
jgi:hypothetical protein